MDGTFFTKTETILDDNISHHQDRYRLTADQLASNYTDKELWGMYLYKKHTDLGQHPVSSEAATMLSTHDLEALLSFTFLYTQDIEQNQIAAETINTCSQELATRDNNKESCNPFL